MAQKVYAVVSQKGGVGKSSAAVSIGAYHSQRGKRVLIVDFDLGNGSAKRWHDERASKPTAAMARLVVLVSNNLTHIGEVAEDFDVVVLDGLPFGGATSVKLASVAHRVIIPTNADDDELEKAAKFAFDLVSAGVNKDRIMFALNRLHSDHGTAEALAALAKIPFKVSPGLRHATGYVNAIKAGKALHEAIGGKLGDEGEAYIRSLVS